MSLRGFENIEELVDTRQKASYLNKPGEYVVQIDVCKYNDKSTNPNTPNAAYFIAECTVLESSNDEIRVGKEVSITYDVNKSVYNKRDSLRFMAAAVGLETFNDEIKSMAFIEAVVGAEQVLKGKNVGVSVDYKDGYDNFAVSKFKPVG